MDHSYSTTATTTASATPVRPGTPDTIGDAITPVPRVNPFASPYGSMPASATGSSTALHMGDRVPGRFFHSRRVRKGEVERPWLDKKDPKEKWVTIIPLIGILVGLAVSGFLVWDGLRTVVNHTYCPVLDEDWSGGINRDVWTREQEVGGFGNGQFEQTTASDENSFIADGALHIRPTLQDQALIDRDSVIDLLENGECSSDTWANCVSSTNTTNGTIVNPVRSARLSAKTKAIRYGRIEVEAKLPAGDWLWPAIWLLPTESVYGPWPRSGEIDIVESRGNNYTYAQGGNNIVSSALHWGPNPANDAWWLNNVKRQALHTTYAKGFHTFGLEWSEKYLFTYVDTRLLQVLYANFDQRHWPKGRFPLTDSNGTRLTDPWAAADNNAAPFDQDFYLILNVAVGGTNGWFEDGKSGKPWVDSSPTARRDFWEARDQWLPTWEENGELQIKSVKIMQQQGHNGCTNGQKWA